MGRISSTVLAAACILGTAACTGKFSTQTFESADSLPLSEGADARLEIKIDVEYPSAGIGRKALQNIKDALTVSLFGEDFTGMEPQEAIDAYRQKASEEYKETNLPLLEASDPAFPQQALNWSDYIYGTIGEKYGDILPYTMTKYVYTGGAHGMTSQTALNFDMKTGTLLTEGDFFKEDYTEDLSALLTRHLPESLDQPADTSALFTTTIGPNGNFLVSGKGVTYIYNQYEIAPYAMGAISVTVPWDELEGLVNL